MSVKLQTDEIRNGRRSWFHPKTEKISRRCLQQLIYVFILIYYLSKHPSVRMSPCFVLWIIYRRGSVTLWSRSSLLGLTVRTRLQKLSRSPRNNQSHNSNLSCLHFGFLWITQKKQRFCFSPLSPTLGRTCLKFLIAGGSSSMTRTCRC